MEIYRYKADTMLGYERVTVDDNYQLKASELRELPDPCYTPMILDSNGNLVSNSLEGSNEEALSYLKDNGISSTPLPSAQDKQIASLTVQIAQQSQTSAAQISLLTKQVAMLQQTVNDLKSAKEG